MILKYLKDNTTHTIPDENNAMYENGTERLRFNTKFEAKDGGFTLSYPNAESLIDCSDYKVVYEDEENYTVFTKDTNTYYTYFNYDTTTKYVTSQITTTSNSEENAVLRFSGKGKAYQYPEQAELFDADGFNKYKVVNGKVVDTTAAEKEAYMAAKTAEELISAKQSKIAEIDAAATAAILGGIDYGNQHFSYSTSDQANLANAVSMAQQTGMQIPYHADNTSCQLYDAADILAIYAMEEMNVTQNITYANQLKMYVNTLGTKTAVDAITYGQKLTGQYLETYNEIMTQSEDILRHIIGEN